jgi:nitrite reductase (NO-forming)
MHAVPDRTTSSFIDRRGHMTVRSLAAAALVVLASLVLSPVAAPAGQATVTVTATEFKFKLSTSSAKAGKVTFKVVNKGKLDHDFKIAGKKTPMIKPGKSATITATVKKGKNAYICTVPGHATAGMKGSFTGK